MRVIASSPRTAALERLVLDTCELQSLELSMLIRVEVVADAAQAESVAQPARCVAIRTLAAAPVPQQLHALALADADLDDTAGQALAKVAWLGKLAALDLSGNHLGRGGAGLRGVAPEAMRWLRRWRRAGSSARRRRRSRGSGRSSSSSTCRATRSPMPGSSGSPR